MRHTFHKYERLCSRRLIDDLFAGGAKSFSVFPLRAVFKHGEGANTQVLVSVSKRRLRHAVDRNRAKRQVREAYRLNKDILQKDCLLIAFVWLPDTPVSTERVMRSMRTLLLRINETDC